MRKSLTLLAPVVTLAVAVATAAPAAAQTNVSTYSAGLASLAIFGATNSPETISINDRLADGRSALAQIRLDSLSTNDIEYWNQNGAGTTATADINLAEGRVVWVRACEGEFGPRTVYSNSCGAWKKGVA